MSSTKTQKMPVTAAANEVPTDVSQLNLTWFNVFAVIPCIIFFLISINSSQAGVGMLALLFLPVATVTVALDIYSLIKRITKK